jgi:hypothetical protein
MLTLPYKIGRKTAAAALLLSLPVLLTACPGDTTGLTLQVTTIGNDVTVTILVNDADDLYGLAMDLVYDPAAYEYVEAAEGPFLAQGGATNFAAALENGVPGRVIIGLSLTGDVAGVNGSGTLVEVNFSKVGDPTEGFAMENVQLLDSNLDPIGFE